MDGMCLIDCERITSRVGELLVGSDDVGFTAALQ
jgi:hypothetical protein